MQGISIFKQTYAAGASRVVMGFDSAINTYSPYAIGCIVGKSYAMAAAVVNEDSDHWHIVNLNTKHGFDAVAVLGAIDEDAAASIAMRDFGRFKESAMWDSVIATNTGGLKRYIDSPLCVKGRKVFTGEIGAMQDMAAGQKILWDGICLQSHQGSIRVLLSDMVQHDDESALVEKFDGLNAWLAESDVEVLEFDALVVENYRLEQTMAKLASAMGAASGQGGVSVTNVTQTKAVKLRNSGAIQVGVSFELSDGQAVTAIFNHADSETQKLGLKDTLFSWKWKLNSRDISAAVQPNNFEDVKLDILAGRIMKLVNANSARFQRSQAKKLENEQALADGNARIAEKKATLESLKSEIESLHIQADEKAKADQAAIETKVEDQPHEPEQHYSEKIIAQLIAAHGWTKAATTTSAKKEFAGLDEAGLLSDGGRIVYATFIGDAKRYLSLQVGYDDVLDMDMRPYDGDDEAIAAGAKDFNAKVEEWVLAKRGVGVAAKDGDGDGEPIVLTGKELGDFPDTAEERNQYNFEHPLTIVDDRKIFEMNVNGENYIALEVAKGDPLYGTTQGAILFESQEDAIRRAESDAAHRMAIEGRNRQADEQQTKDNAAKQALYEAIGLAYLDEKTQNGKALVVKQLTKNLGGKPAYQLIQNALNKDEAFLWIGNDGMRNLVSGKSEYGDLIYYAESSKWLNKTMMDYAEWYSNSIGKNVLNSKEFSARNEESRKIFKQKDNPINEPENIPSPDPVNDNPNQADIDYLNSVIGGRVDLSDKSITGEVRRIITSNSDNQEIQDLGLQAAKVLAEAKKQLAQTKLAEVQ